MARARKLFPSYGSALAHHVLALLERERMVAKFVSAYVERYDRKGILGGIPRNRELAETIGREIVLATIVEVREVLPRFFGKKRADSLKPEERETVEAFLGEMVAALGRAWNWSEEDEREFQRDLKLYTDFAAKGAIKQKRHASRQQEEPPFVARVALLLDASVLEKSRRASAKFYLEVGSFAQNALRQTLNPEDN
jgi:uncharacterized protein (DUF4415 family)